MKKGIKKAITSPAKETVITDHKRPIHGFCYTHFNMKEEHLTDIEHQFLSALPDGRDNAVTLLKLSRTLNINKHKVSEIVARLRNAGYLVGSSKSRPNAGVFHHHSARVLGDGQHNQEKHSKPTSNLRRFDDP